MQSNAKDNSNTPLQNTPDTANAPPQGLLIALQNLTAKDAADNGNTELNSLGVITNLIARAAAAGPASTPVQSAESAASPTSTTNGVEQLTQQTSTAGQAADVKLISDDNVIDALNNPAAANKGKTAETAVSQTDGSKVSNAAGDKPSNVQNIVSDQTTAIPDQTAKPAETAKTDSNMPQTTKTAPSDINNLQDSDNTDSGTNGVGKNPAAQPNTNTVFKASVSQNNSDSLKQFKNNPEPNSQPTTDSSPAATDASRLTVNTQPLKPAGTAEPASLGWQLEESIRTSLNQETKQITVRLNPPELGRVVMEFKTAADGIIGNLQVTNLQTKYQVEQQLPQVLQTLADAGIHIKHIDVTLSNQQQNFSDQHSAAGFDTASFAQQQNSASASYQQNAASAYSAGNSDIPYLWQTPAQQTIITDSSINVLV